MEKQKRTAKVFIGLLFIAAGVIWGLGAMKIEIFKDVDFTGWWTLFIIIPSAVGLFSDRDKAGAVLGLGIGILLFCAARGWLDGIEVGKLFLSLMMIVIGVACIFGKSSSKNAKKEDIESIRRDGRKIHQIATSFGKRNIELESEVFEGADIKANFGAVRLDLRKALIDGKVLIHVDCSFAGVEILVPEGIPVKVGANANFGGIKDERRNQPSEGSNVIFIDGNISFGGIEIK